MISSLLRTLKSVAINVYVRTQEGPTVMSFFPGIVQKIQQTDPRRKTKDVEEGFQWIVGSTEERSLPGPAQVSTLGPIQEPDGHGEQQGASGGDHPLHCRDSHLGRPE